MAKRRCLQCDFEHGILPKSILRKLPKEVLREMADEAIRVLKDTPALPSENSIIGDLPFIEA